MAKSNVHLQVLDFQNKTVVFFSVFAKKQQKKGCCLWNCFGTQNVEFHARVFFFWKKFQRCLANVKVLRKKKFFYVLCRLLVCFLNHEPFVKEVGTVLRTEAEIFSRVAFERMSGRRKKKSFFFVKVRPRRVFHKNSGARTCLRTRPKYSQSEQTLKKRSPFVYHTQRKHAKLTHSSE